MTAVETIASTNGENLMKDIPSLIAELKAEIGRDIAANAASHLHINYVLKHLQAAEQKSIEGNNLAWYDLMKAQLSYRQNDDACFFFLPDDDPEKLKQDIYRGWRELNKAQRANPQINPANVADWLQWADEVISQEKPDVPKALYYLSRAYASLSKAISCAQSRFWGSLILLLEMFYLWMIPASIFLYHRMSGKSFTQISEAANLPTIIQVPRYVFVWGFLGGVSWCIYSAAHWTKRRLFDRHYALWYVAHPFISIPLSGAAALIFIGGTHTFTTQQVQSSALSGSEAKPITYVALLSLISFFAGFSTQAFWRLLDKTVSKLFGVAPSEASSPPVIIKREIHRSNDE